MRPARQPFAVQHAHAADAPGGASRSLVFDDQQYRSIGVALAGARLMGNPFGGSQAYSHLLSMSSDSQTVSSSYLDQGSLRIPVKAPQYSSSPSTRSLIATTDSRLHGKS